MFFNRWEDSVYTITETNGVLICQPQAELISGNGSESERLLKFMKGFIENNPDKPDILIDLSLVRKVDAVGQGVLVVINDNVRRHGGALHLVLGRNTSFYHELEESTLMELFCVFDTREDALARFK